MKTHKIISKAVTLFLLTIFLISCSSNKSTTTGSGSGSGSGSTTSGVTLKTGVFLDSKVAGMSYVSGGQSGDTDANGGFTYEDGKDVTFKVGDITIGTASGSAVMTPVTLVPGAKDPTDPTVTNITRFLMTISDNGDPNNGIVITPAIKAAAAGKSVNFNVDTTTFTNNTATVITTLTDASTTGAKTLVTVGDAQKHLGATLTLKSIAVTPTNPTIALGVKEQFTAIGTYTDGSTQDITSSVTWSSSSTDIASIDNNGNANTDSNGHIIGRATGLSVGSTTITASLSGISGTTTLTITAATLSSIAITPTNPSIALGTTKQFTATGTYTDGSHQDLTASVTWSSDTKSAATIDSKGFAASVGTGTTTITAAFSGINGTTKLTVTAATLSSIAVTPANPSIALGTTKQFTATGTYSDNSTQNLTTSVTWSSSSTTIATISNVSGSNGLATGNGIGSTTITASLSGISGTTKLTVTAATLSSIAVTPANPSIANGTTKQFTATGTYSDSTTQDITTSVTWSSSNTSKATISNAGGSNGLATSVAVGPSTITASLNSISGTTTLTVTAATLSTIAITPANPYIVINNPLQLTAIGTYSDNTTQDITTTVTWSSSDTSKAAISNASGSNGLATGVGAGTTTITATLNSINGTTTLTVIKSVVPFIASGFGFTIALKSDGTVWTWGWNYIGELGNITNFGTFNPTPTQVSGLTGIMAIAGGGHHTIALKSDGTVWAWGDNNPTPTQVSGLTGVTAIAGVVETSSIALKSDGTVWAWGRNNYGQLGIGSVDNNAHPTPTQVSGLAGVTAIAGGGVHTIALKSDGTVWAWGYNYSGQLGNLTNVGTYNPNPTPTQVNGLTGVTAIAGGGYHTIALKSDGTVWTWGDNYNGQLGDGTQIERDTPVQVINADTSPFTGVTAIAGGYRFTIALKSDGTVWAWGDNQYGELGNTTNVGTQNPNTTPTQANISGVTAVAGRGYYTIALKSDGTIWTWGDNSYGQLGNMTNVGIYNPNPTPAEVLGAGGVGYLNLN